MLVAGSTPLIIPQNEQEFGAADLVTSETVSLEEQEQEQEEEEEEEDEDEEQVVNHREPSVMDFVPAPASDHSSSATLAEIFRCFICLGKVHTLSMVSSFSQVGDVSLARKKMMFV